MKNRQLTLEEIVTFLNRIEQNVSEAALQNVITMPKGGELLRYSANGCPYTQCIPTARLRYGAWSLRRSIRRIPQ